MELRSGRIGCLPPQMTLDPSFCNDAWLVVTVIPIFTDCSCLRIYYVLNWGQLIVAISSEHFPIRIFTLKSAGVAYLRYCSVLCQLQNRTRRSHSHLQQLHTMQARVQSSVDLAAHPHSRIQACQPSFTHCTHLYTTGSLIADLLMHVSTQPLMHATPIPSTTSSSISLLHLMRTIQAHIQAGDAMSSRKHSTTYTRHSFGVLQHSCESVRCPSVTSSTVYHALCSTRAHTLMNENTTNCVHAECSGATTHSCILISFHCCDVSCLAPGSCCRARRRRGQHALLDLFAGCLVWHEC